MLYYGDLFSFYFVWAFFCVDKSSFEDFLLLLLCCVEWKKHQLYFGLLYRKQTIMIAWPCFSSLEFGHNFLVQCASRRLSSYFLLTDIYNRGEVLLKSALDRETDATFRFQVIAYDGYYYSVPAATIDVIVLDVNDNEPKFVDTYKFTVSGEYAYLSALFLLYCVPFCYSLWYSFETRTAFNLEVYECYVHIKFTCT